MGHHRVQQTEFEALVKETETIFEDADRFLQYCQTRQKLLDSMLHVQSLN